LPFRVFYVLMKIKYLTTVDFNRKQ
jgi:hypothetical protein